MKSLSVLLLLVVASVSFGEELEFRITPLEDKLPVNFKSKGLSQEGKLIGNVGADMFDPNSKGYVYDIKSEVTVELKGVDTGVTGVFVRSVNANGIAVGVSSDVGDHIQATLWDAGSDIATSLGDFNGTQHYSVAVSINDNGQVIGESINSSGTTQGFIWDGSLHPLGPANGSQSTVNDVNMAGIVVGQSFGTARYSSPDDNYATWVAIPGVTTSSTLQGINDSGIIAGDRASQDSSHVISFYLDVNDPNTQNLIAPFETNASIRVTDINNNGLIVGNAFRNGHTVGYVYDISNNTLTDLNDLLEPIEGFRISDALHVNDKGEFIVDYEAVVEEGAGLGLSAASMSSLGLAFVAPFLRGDVNDDHIVNQLDLNVVFGNWLTTGAHLSQGDANEDGVINQLDINTITGNWLSAIPSRGFTGFGNPSVPEPSGIVLFLVGAGFLGFLVRRIKRVG